jgi:hypothetical protein
MALWIVWVLVGMPKVVIGKRLNKKGNMLYGKKLCLPKLPRKFGLPKLPIWFIFVGILMHKSIF